MDGFGNINWWGFSPSLDLLEDLNPKLLESSEEINILLVCAGDQRHIIRTLAELTKSKQQRSNAKKKKINFYVYEKMLELYARDFLLLSVLLEHPAKRGVQEKTELFLEIFGNLLVRDHTCKYVQARADEFIRYITDLEHLQTTNLNIFNFELLKYKERDFLEGIFKFWRLENEPNKPYFPAEKYWDFRLRTYFGTRYDTRKNAYDWDFSMKLSDRKHAAVIHHKLYAKWRETGVAFELRDTEYDKANFTLASATCLTDPRSGDKTGRRGYFGDMILGPYCAYGIETTDENKFYKKQNELYKHTATEISQENLNTYAKSIIELSDVDLKKYCVQDKSSLSGSKITEIIEEEEESEGVEESTPDYINLNDRFRIHFLPLASFNDFGVKEKYEKFFHIAYFANNAGGLMDAKVAKILKEEASVIVESAKFMIELTGEKILGFSERIRQIGIDSGLEEIEVKEKTDSEKPKFELSNVLKFKKV